MLALSSSPVIAQGTIRDNAKVVLELFTSQGCPNSPKADVLLAELAELEDVIALAYHVDYWDYIGWRDTFGDAAFTARQRDYSALRGTNRLYTPQLMVNGSVDVVGSDRREVAAAVEKSELPLDIELAEANGILTIDIPAKRDLPSATVWLVTYVDDAKVQIGGGENAGQTLSYVHVVTGRQVLSAWEPGEGAHLKVPVSELLVGQNDGAAIVVQTEVGDHPGPIIGAAMFEAGDATR